MIHALLPVDIDECVESPSPVCDAASEDCVNTPGGFECRCKAGHIFYSGNNSCLGKDKGAWYR